MDVAAKGAQYSDLHGLSELKAKAGRNPDDLNTLKQVASQFESMFTQMLLKAQRDAGFGDPLFDSSAMDFYKDMHDKQLSLHMAENGGVGLADMIVAQLSRGKVPETSATDASLDGYFSAPVMRAPMIAKQEQTWGDAQEFVEALRPHAQRGAEALGIDPEFIMAQAALETGWGQSVPADGRGTSFNVFGIKAQSDWSGERIWSKTLEYSGEQFESVRESFRRYQSLGDSVDDYVNFLQQNPRYQDALKAATQGAETFAQELGKAGYATDPKYSEKIIGVMQSKRLQTAQE